MEAVVMQPFTSYKPKKAHNKSRNGCKNCRRRKVKCDETKPKCRTCANRDEYCEYRTRSPPSQPQTFTSPSTRTLGYGLTQIAVSDNIADIVHDDLSLFDHYLRHTCRALALPDGHEYARRIELPLLASKSKGLLCSILAFGAACLCVDLLLGSDPIAATDRVAHLITTGDYYHRKALTAVLSRLGTKCPQELDAIHAQAAMLWAYAPARRRIFRLLQRQQPELALVEQEPDADAPHNLEWASLLRGVNAVTKFRSTRSFQDNSGRELAGIPESELPDAFVSAYVVQAVEVERDLFSLSSPCTKSGSGHRHVMNNIISSSVSEALDKLHGQVNILELKLRHKQRSDVYCGSLAGMESQFSVMSSLVACYTALIMLETTANGIFGIFQSVKAKSLSGTPSYNKAFGGSLNDSFSFKGSPWLKALCKAPEYDPSEPVTRGLLPWISHLPKEYFDIIVTHYPDRSKVTSLTVEQQIHCLAWDIYAHWLVLTILMEHEAWYWADMGHSDIRKLRDTLPKSNVSGYGVEVGIHNWWPWQMWLQAQKLRT